MTATDPIALFKEWHGKAVAVPLPNAQAMALATVGADGVPSCRMVLLSSVDERGFVFHSNYHSRKGRELELNPAAALVFWWDALAVQVRVEGRVEKTSHAESDVYFATRPRGSQIGAWASGQSEPLADRQMLEGRVAALEAEYDGRRVARPPHWGGYRLVPRIIEFWHGRDDRLHDRWRYTRADSGAWEVKRLAP